LADSKTSLIKTVRTATSVVEIYSDHVIKTLIHKTDKERLWAEATALKVLGDSEVSPRLLHQGEKDGQDYLKMERIEGATLHDAHFPKSQTVDGIAFSVIHNLATIHETDLLHRDFKPSNLIVEDLGNVRVIDFGCSTTASGPKEKPKQFLYSTPCVIPPEIHLGKSPWTKRGEVFSLGVVLYHLYSGKYPFGNGKSDEIAERACFEEPEAINHPVWPIIHNCLVKDPSKRYQSANEVLGELIAYQSGQAIEYRTCNDSNWQNIVLRNSFLITVLLCLLSLVWVLFSGWLDNRGNENSVSFPAETPVESRLVRLQRMKESGTVPVRVEHRGGYRITVIQNADFKIRITDQNIHEIPVGNYSVRFIDPRGKNPDYFTTRIVLPIGSRRLEMHSTKKTNRARGSVRLWNVARDSSGWISHVTMEGFPIHKGGEPSTIRVAGRLADFQNSNKKLKYTSVMSAAEGTNFILPTKEQLYAMKSIDNPEQYICYEDCRTNKAGKVVLVSRSSFNGHEIDYSKLKCEVP